MSGLEIERKFLVRKGDAYKNAAFSSSHIKQGYIPADSAINISEGINDGFSFVISIAATVEKRNAIAYPSAT